MTLYVHLILVILILNLTSFQNYVLICYLKTFISEKLRTGAAFDDRQNSEMCHHIEHLTTHVFQKGQPKLEEGRLDSLI